MVIYSFDFLIKLLSGGAVGYITNLLAIKMLFKKYPLIGGGVILETYEELQDRLSELVERDLINDKTLETEIRSEHFKQTFDGFLEDILQNSLSGRLKDKNITDITNYELLSENMLNFLNKEELVDKLDFSVILKNLELKDLASDKQVNTFSSKIFDILSQVIVPELNKFVGDLYQELDSKSANDFLSPELVAKITSNIDLLCKDLPNRLKEFDTEINLHAKNYLKLIGIDEIIVNLEKSLKEKTFVELIGNDSNFTTHLMEYLSKIINSKEGKIFLDSLSKILFELVKDNKKPLTDFFTPNLNLKLVDFVKNNIVHLSDYSKDWLRNNKVEIDQLIDSAIEEYYAEKKTFGSQFKLLIKDVIDLKVSEYFDIVEKGVEKLENYIEKEAPNDISLKIVEFLKNKTFGDLIADFKLEKSSLGSFFQDLVNKYLLNPNSTFIKYLVNLKMGDLEVVKKLNLAEFFEEKLEKILIEQIKNNFIYSDKLAERVSLMLKENIYKITNLKISELMPKSKIDGYLAGLPLLLMFGKGKIISKIEEGIKSELNNINIEQIFKENFEASTKDKLKVLAKEKSKALLESFKNFNLDQPYHNLIDTFDFRSKTSLITNKFADNLKKFTDSKISKGVHGQVKKFSPEQLRDKVEDFMGKELQPITWLGAILGVLSGGALYFTQDIPSVATYTTGYYALVSVPLTYAVVGIGTNWIAIKMLFEPYEQKKFLGLPLPLTPGIVGKRKPQFAENMGKFVSSELINKETLTNIFNHGVKGDIKEYIAKDNYEIIDSLIKKDTGEFKDKTGNFISDKLLNFINSKKESISSSFSTTIINFELKEIQKDTFNTYYDKVIVKTQAFMNNFLKPLVNNYKSKKITELSEPSNEKIKNTITQILDTKITNFSVKLAQETFLEEKLKMMFSNLDKIIDKESTLKNFITEDKNKEAIIDYLTKALKNKLEVSLNKYSEQILLKEEFSPEKQLKDIFNGELSNFINKHISTVLDYVIFGAGLEKLKSEKENISEKIVASVRASNKDSILYTLGDSLFKVEDDIKEIVHLIIDKKLEPYLKDKKGEFEHILTNYIDIVSRKKLNEVGISKELINNTTIKDFISKMVDNNELNIIIPKIIEIFYDNLLEIKLKNLLEILNITNLETLVVKIEPEFEIIKNTISKNLENKAIFTELSTNISKELFDKYLSKIEIKELLNNISEAELEKEINSFTNLIYTSEVFKNYQKQFFEQIHAKVQDKKVGDFLDTNLFETELKILFDKILENEELKANFTNIIKNLTNNLLDNLNIIIDKDTKDKIVDLLIESLVESFSKKAEDIFKALNISTIVVREINAMHPREIEKLFYSFAGTYFTKLILYGWLGGIIGIFDALLVLK